MHNKKFAIPATKVVATMMALGICHTAQAGGFSLVEQSASGQGNAFAGGSAVAEDASTVYFNPAGMTRLAGSRVLLAGHIIKTSANFHNNGSHLNPKLGPFGGPLSGGDGGNAGQTAYIPNFYLTTQLPMGFSAGFGVNVPFGLQTDYSDGWTGRYQALHSRVETINLNPSLAYAFNRMFSIGAGVNYQYVDAKLTNAVDFGSICLAAAGPATCAAAGVLPTTADGKVKLTGNDWSWGFNLGVLFQPWEHTRFGLAYRSKVSHTLKGDARFRVPDQAKFLTAGGAFTKTNAKVDLNLPETVSFSAFHSIGPRWDIMGDVTWTRWNRFDELKFEFGNPAQPTSTQPEDWENTYRYSVGLNFHPNQKWTLRTGGAYDESPIPGTNERTPRIPGNNRYWLSFGVGYKFNQRLRFDLGYSHLFIDNAKIDDTEVSTGHTIKGKYTDLDVDIVSAQVEWRFL